MLWVLAAAAAAADSPAGWDSCDAGASRALALTTLVDGCDSEACVCAAMLLGKQDVAKVALAARLARGEGALRVRNYAVDRRDAAAGLIARLNPRYPRHLKSVPALIWGETAELLHLRVRFARYTTGEAMARRVEHVNVSLTAGGLYVSAESADRTPAFFETTVAWLHPLRRADGCADAEAPEQCAAWFEAGECEGNPAYMRERCALSCGACAGGVDAPAQATWALREGELVVEGRKAAARSWPRPLATASPANRILRAEALDGNTTGLLLACVEDCAAAAGAAGPEGCRARCEASDAAPALQYDAARPPRVAAGRQLG